MTAKTGNATESFHKADNMADKPGKDRYDFSDLSISTHIRIEAMKTQKSRKSRKKHSPTNIQKMLEKL
jgi:hypothetical protein